MPATPPLNPREGAYTTWTVDWGNNRTQIRTHEVFDMHRHIPHGGGKNRHRSSMFRNCGNSHRIIHLHNIDGTRTIIKQPGKLNQATHQTVLQALGQRASRFRVGGRLVSSEATSHSWSLLDKTGTTNASFNREGIQQQERIDI